MREYKLYKCKFEVITTTSAYDYDHALKELYKDVLRAMNRFSDHSDCEEL